jgi:hypothetical protein
MNNLFLKLIKRYRFNPLVKSVLTATGSVPKPEKWVFIVGCYNSGTTLLESLLGNHPDIGSMRDEGVILTGHLTRPEDFGWTRMWHQCYDQLKMDETAEEALAIKVKKHWSHAYPKRKILIEKSISNATRIPFFNRYFQPAYFIYIVRNGYAVAEGIRRKANPAKYRNNRYQRYPIELCARQWQETHNVIMKAKSITENFLQLSYEDLCANPERTLRSCTDFLKIAPIDTKVLEAEHKIHQHHSSIKNMNEQSFRSLTEEDKNAIESEARQALDFYQYKRPGK